MSSFCRFLLVAVACGGLSSPAVADNLDALVAKHAAANGVPPELVRRVIRIESRGRPHLISKGNYGLMQIRLGTARAMGYTGDGQGLLDADTNMTYAVRYLAGAYRAARGNADKAVRLYQRGYYYDAKRMGFSPYQVASRSAAPVAPNEPLKPVRVKTERISGLHARPQPVSARVAAATPAGAPAAAFAIEQPLKRTQAVAIAVLPRPRPAAPERAATTGWAAPAVVEQPVVAAVQPSEPAVSLRGAAPGVRAPAADQSATRMQAPTIAALPRPRPAMPERAIAERPAPAAVTASAPSPSLMVAAPATPAPAAETPVAATAKRTTRGTKTADPPSRVLGFFSWLGTPSQKPKAKRAARRP